MQRYIAFLRAINVGGRNVKMAELRELIAALGLAEVSTFIASGNVIFSCRSQSPAALEKRIEDGLETALGYPIDTFIRTPTELAAIARHQAFSAAEVTVAVAFNIAFLKQALDPATQQTLTELTTDVDRFHTHNRQVYWLCTVKQSESKISNAVFERKLQLKTTVRGINTITRLLAKIDSC